MKIGLLIIGNEILEGRIADANTRQLALFLQEHQLELQAVQIVSDETSQIHQALQYLYQSCQMVITSGGLGPTQDDITKESLASFFGKKVQFSLQSKAVAENNYLRFNRPFPGDNHGYCFLPDAFEALDNSTGFAPGLFYQDAQRKLLAGPGVPWEFLSLLKDHFLRLTLQERSKQQLFLSCFTARTKKIPEEKIFREVDSELWSKLSVFGNVSSLPTTFGVDVGVKIKATTAEELETKLARVKEIFLASPLASHIWQYGTRTLEEMIVNLARAKQVNFAFAESCTGGLCAHRITNIAGSSENFCGSIVSYQNSAKQNLLCVQSEVLNQVGAVSEVVAMAMAQGAREAFKTSLAIAITGVAGPGGGTTEHPVGTAWFGVSHGERKFALKLQFHGDREQLKQRFAQAALYLLLEELEKIA
jgi:nicotinamide-nucleotide amidase